MPLRGGRAAGKGHRKNPPCLSLKKQSTRRSQNHRKRGCFALFLCRSVRLLRCFAPRKDKGGGHCGIASGLCPSQRHTKRVTTNSSFRPFLGHCEPRFFVWRSNLRLLRFARNGEKCRRIASLRSQRRKMPPDCFVASLLAVTPAVSLRGRIFVSEAVSPFCPNKRVSAQGLLRFARNDAHEESLRGHRLAPFSSLRASFVRLAKQSQGFLAASRLRDNSECSIFKTRFPRGQSFLSAPFAGVTGNPVSQGDGTGGRLRRCVREDDRTGIWEELQDDGLSGCPT